MPRGFATICFLFLALNSLCPAEAPPGGETATHLPPQAQMVNGVLVPVSGEVFRVLDGFHDSNWKAVLRPDLAALSPAGSPAHVALCLGLVISEGFVAITAEDTAEMQDLGKAAIKLARALGVEKAMLRREKSIIEHVDQKDWAAVRREWSEVNTDLKGAMLELKSESLSQLVSLGGWLRGLEVLAALNSQHYSASDARLLSQPVLLECFDEQLSKLDNRSKDDPLVGEMRRGLQYLRPLLGSKHAPPLSAPEVNDVLHASSKLVTSIRAGSN